MENGIVVIALIVVLIIIHTFVGAKLNYWGILTHPADLVLYGSIFGVVIGIIIKGV